MPLEVHSRPEFEDPWIPLQTRVERLIAFAGLTHIRVEPMTEDVDLFTVSNSKTGRRLNISRGIKFIDSFGDRSQERYTWLLQVDEGVWYYAILVQKTECMSWVAGKGLSVGVFRTLQHVLLNRCPMPAGGSPRVVADVAPPRPGRLANPND
jgi:hypothetical protein